MGAEPHFDEQMLTDTDVLYLVIDCIDRFEVSRVMEQPRLIDDAWPRIKLLFTKIMQHC